jgi:hypothetical protein
VAGLIAAYLDDLARDLRVGRVGPALLDRILGETEAHLLDRAGRYRERGALPDEAERRAIARFGSARTIARQFAADRATGAARTASRVLLPGAVCLWLVLQVGGHFLPAGSKLRDAGASAGALAAAIDLYSLALVIAMAGCLFAWWRLERQPRGAAMAPRELGRVATALATVVAAEVVAGVTTALLVFRLPGPPPPQVPAAVAASELLAVLIGAAFALRAIARCVALATIGEEPAP